MSALFDSGCEVNGMHPTLAREIGLPIRPTDVGVQKIYSTILDTFGLVVTIFSMRDKANRVRFFKETFLVANVSPKVVFGMPFLTLSCADVDILGQELSWRTYNTEKVLSTIRRIELMGKKEFVAAAIDLKYETYVVYIELASSDALPSSSLLNIHPSQRPQISGLIAEKAPTKVFAKYSDFIDVFLINLASKLPKHTGINNHAIKLVDGYQQPPYGSIYSLGPVELETLKTYIETNLANGFIKSSKSPAGAPIPFK